METARAALSTPPQAMEESAMQLSPGKMYYILDKGPLCAVTTAPEGPAEADVNLFSWRAFGLPRMKSLHAGIPGHYIVNTEDTLAGQQSAQVLELPGIVTFKDAGTPSMIGINFKAGSNGKLYVQCIPTTLKQKPDPDADYKHINDKDIKLFNIALVTGISPIADENGQPLRKNFNAWLKEGHSATMKRLKLKNLTDFKVRMRPSMFSQNITDAIHAWAEEFRKQSEAECGQSESNPAAAHSTAEISEVHRLQKEKFDALVKKTKDGLLEHVQALAVSTGFRIIEVDCSQPVTEDSIAKSLENKVAPNHYDAILATLQGTGLLEELQKLTDESDPLSVTSPVKAAPVVVENSEPAEEEPEGSPIPENVVELRKKRKKPERLSDELDKAASTAQRTTPVTSGASSFTAGSTTASSSGTSDSKTARKYVKSGKYSRNPVKRAQKMSDILQGGKGDKPPLPAGASLKGVCLLRPLPHPYAPPKTDTTPLLICRESRGSRAHYREGEGDQGPAKATGRQGGRDRCQSHSSRA